MLGGARAKVLVGMSSALGLVALGGCGSYRPTPTAYRAPATAARTWDDVLKQPGKITVTTWETGRVLVHRDDLLDFDDPKTKGLANDEYLVPVFAHWLHHDDKGDYLIDTGLDSEFQKTTSGDMRGLFAGKFHAEQRPGEDIVARLAAGHIQLKGVFFTHLHPDHVSGAAHLDKATPLVVGEGEPTKSYGFLFYNDALADARDFEELHFADAPSMPPLGRSIDVLGDGSFWAVFTPGHTKGHVSYLALTKTGPMLFTGDVSHTRWGFDNNVIPGGFNDGSKNDSRNSLGQLRAFVTLHPQVKLVFGHEL